VIESNDRYSKRITGGVDHILKGIFFLSVTEKSWKWVRGA